MATNITHGDEPPYTLDTPLEDVLAAYGDASASSWTDPKYTVYRDRTGGAWTRSGCGLIGQALLASSPHTTAPSPGAVQPACRTRRRPAS